MQVFLLLGDVKVLWLIYDNLRFLALFDVNIYKKYNQKLHHVEYYDGKWKHKFC